MSAKESETSASSSVAGTSTGAEPEPESVSVSVSPPEMITLNITLHVPKTVENNMQSWLLEYFTNLRVSETKKTSDSAYALSVRLQEKLISVTQMMDDNIKLGEFAQIMQKELTEASETVEMYHQLNEKDEEEIDRLRKQIIKQSYLIESLAKESKKCMQEKEGMEIKDIELLIASMKSEKEELVGKAAMIAEGMKLLEIQMKASSSSQECSLETDFQPPVQLIRSTQ